MNLVNKHLALVIKKMKSIKILILMVLASNTLIAQKMDKKIVNTKMGNIAVFCKYVNNSTPIIFLHGVYFDHHLWDKQISEINDRTVISIDMPLHGESREQIITDWNLEDCARMLLVILDSLKMPKVIAIGHSWGSMTILRACAKNPERFQSIGLCNMPWQSGKQQKFKFALQHSMLGFRKFYTMQAAKSLFGKTNLRKNPFLLNQLANTMNSLSKKDIQQIDKAVIINANDASILLKNLKVSALALIGEDDYLKAPPFIKTETVQGGHVSPLQAPDAVHKLIKELVNLR
jgi:3-oxoadipate enol-lactonase